VSVTTQLQIRSLVRDSSGQLASQVGALRRAENVVLRAPGVAESRPNFELLHEDLATDQRVMGLVEYMGEAFAVDRAVGLYWRLRRLSTGVSYTNPLLLGNGPEPASYDDCEPKFAEARSALYIPTIRGVMRLSNVLADAALGFTFAGVERNIVTDFATANANFGTPVYSWAYVFVAVRLDPIGYTVRRGPPSARIVVTGLATIPGLATRVYFDPYLRVDERIEAYRSRRAEGTAPSTELYLAWTHTLTATNIVNGWFIPPYDITIDDDLGAALYTNPSQGGALAAKYPPPRAQVLAPFESCMWYGRTVSKQRVSLTIRSVGLGGPMRGAVPGEPALLATFTAASAVVAINTAGLVAGADFSDNRTRGSVFAGTYVPALTTILSVDTPMQITMSAAALGSGNAIAGMMSRYAPSGIAAGIGGGGTHVLGSPIVTLIADTSILRVGMGWSDAVAGPATIGTLTAGDTWISTIDSPTQITLNKNALANGVGAAAYDRIEIIGGLAPVSFYAYPGDTLLAARTAPWAWPVRCVPFWSEGFFDGCSMGSFISSLATAINYYYRSAVEGLRAYVVGDTNYDDKIVTNWPRSVIFEEIGLGDNQFEVWTSRPSAWEQQPKFKTTNDDRPHRVYWSDPDEPETVRLTSYADIGTESAPILALVPLRSALLVFKTDGVYRITGSAPNSWAVECIDTSLRLLRPECVTAVDDKAFCWAEGGFFVVTSSGARSISAGALDVELNVAARYVLASTTTHGAFVVADPSRQIVLFGVPSSLAATATSRIYVYSLVTEGFSEWPLAWGHAAESAVGSLYYSEPVGSLVEYEVRKAVTSPRGYDRVHDISAIVSLTGAVLVVSVGATGQWVPTVNDVVSAIGDAAAVRTYRRITEIATGGGNYTFTLESTISGTGVLSLWKAYEVARCVVILEWHPASPAGIPTGSICRELQVQLDLRAWPNDEKNVSLPEYIVGGTSERDATPHTVTSNRARVAQIQPLRVGCSRQIARSANVAAYFKSGDIFALRINGLSLVWEGTSERTRQ
jgi:hypothetical protein